MSYSFVIIHGRHIVYKVYLNVSYRDYEQLACCYKLLEDDSLSFTRKYNLLGLFRFIWIKGHFPLVGPIFSRSSFNSLVDCVTSLTTEKSDVSSAKSLVIDDNTQLRSLIYIKKNTWPRTDPWRTAAEKFN